MSLPASKSSSTVSCQNMKSMSTPDWARKPLLGFSTWSTQLLDDIPGYGGKHIKPWFNESEIKAISDAMAMRLPNYEFINLDSGWSEECDEFGRWTYRHDLFPGGLKALSDYLKNNGHKLGLYMLPGVRKDAYDANTPVKGTNYRVRDIVVKKKDGNGFKGTTYMTDALPEVAQAYYDSIADQYAEWGVAYVKLDGCGPGGGDEYYPYQAPDNRECLKMMAKAFHRHNIWVEISWYMDHTYVEDWAQHANGARIFIDIESYSTNTMTSSHRVFQRITQAARWVEKGMVGSDYGFFLDLDAVLVGMVVDGSCVDGLDNDDIRMSYISFWALVSSVFCIGADPRMIPDKYLAMLNNSDILMIHQAGNMAQPVENGDVWQNRRQIWWKSMPDGRICVGLFNAHTYIFMLGIPHTFNLDLLDVGIPSKRAEVYNIWEGQSMGVVDGTYTVRLRPGQCQMLFLTPIV